MTFSPLVLDNGQIKRLQSSEFAQANTPCVRVLRQSTNQSLNSSVQNPIVFDTQAFSHGGSWWSNANAQRIFIPVAGIYFVGAYFRLSGLQNSSCSSDLLLNDTRVIASDDFNYCTGNQPFSPQCFYPFNQGDSIQLRVFYAASGSRIIYPETGTLPALWAFRVR